LSAIVPVSFGLSDSRNLESWLSTIKQFRIHVVLVLDAPDEKLSRIQKELKLNFSNNQVTITNVSFGNPGAARNEGIRFAKGDWIAFWDSDDLPNVEQTKNLVAIHGSKDFDLLVQDYSIKSNPQNSIHHIKIVNGENSDLLDNLSFNPGIWRLIFRKDSIQNILFPTLLMAEDQLFIAEFEPWKRRILYTGVENYQYFKGVAGQLTSNSEAISDLIFSTNALISKIVDFEFDKVGKVFLSNMLFRQITTSFVRGNISTKIRIATTIITLPMKVKRQVFMAGIRYLKFARSSLE